MRNRTLAGQLSKWLLVSGLLLGLLSEVMADQPTLTKSSYHHKILATSDFTVYSIRLGRSELSDPWYHSQPVLLIPLGSREILEHAESKQAPTNITWKARNGVTVVKGGTAHKMFNPHSSDFLGLEIEATAERKVMWALKPRFSEEVREQYWTSESIRLGRHVLFPNEKVLLGGSCQGVVVPWLPTQLKIEEPSAAKVLDVQAGQPVVITSTTMVTNASRGQITFTSICAHSKFSGA